MNFTNINTQHSHCVLRNTIKSKKQKNSRSELIRWTNIQIMIKITMLIHNRKRIIQRLFFIAVQQTRLLSNDWQIIKSTKTKSMHSFEIRILNLFKKWWTFTMIKNFERKRIEYRVISMKTNEKLKITRFLALSAICSMLNIKFIIDRFYKLFVFYLNMNHFETIWHTFRFK